MEDKRFRSDRERDPVAELARLIAQDANYEESASSGNRFREETASHGHGETPELPQAPQLAVDLDEHEQASECDEHGAGDHAYDVDDQLYSVEGEYRNNEVPRVRRRGLTLLMAIFGLGLIGTACVVGYRDIFGGSVSPASKAINERNSIASTPSGQRVESGGSARPVDPPTTGSIDNMVSHEDRPATIGAPKAAPRASPPIVTASTRLSLLSQKPMLTVPRQ